MREVVIEWVSRVLCVWLLAALAPIAAAEQIKVPVVWEDADHSIRRIGFYEDLDRYVWAVVSDHLQDVAASQRFAVGFYLNADDDVNTGRFAGDAGYDLQFNLRLKPLPGVALMHWEGDTNLPLPAYPDDSYLTVTGNVAYLAIRKEIFARHPLHAKHLLRVTMSSV